MQNITIGHKRGVARAKTRRHYNSLCRYYPFIGSKLKPITYLFNTQYLTIGIGGNAKTICRKAKRIRNRRCLQRIGVYPTLIIVCKQHAKFTEKAFGEGGIIFIESIVGKFRVLTVITSSTDTAVCDITLTVTRNLQLFAHAGEFFKNNNRTGCCLFKPYGGAKTCRASADYGNIKKLLHIILSSLPKFL